MTTEQLKDLIRSVGYTTQAQSMEIAQSIEEALLAENTALSAGQCIHDDGLTADEGGTPYCAKEKRIKELEAALDVALEALKQITAIEDEMYGGDWDEITKAREIARVAIAKLKEVRK